MGLFGTTSPFDPDVEKATSEKNTTEDWGLIMDICDKVGNSQIHAKDCLRSIVKRLNNNDPHVAIQAVTLLDACANNCGKNFHLEIASRDFEGEFRKLLTRTHPTVQLRLKSLLKKWAENEFKTDAQLNLIPSLYYKLRQEGFDFASNNDATPQKRPVMHHVSKDPNVVANQQEEDDIAKAIELSLKEKGSPKAGRNTTSLYPSTNIASVTSKVVGKGAPTEARKVRALYDFEAAEDNELTFKAGEIVHVIDDTDPNWWKGYNQRGEGLFPANFVTADLSVEPEQFKIEAARKRSVQFNEEVVKHVPVEVVEIDENKIDQLLHLLHEADPNDASKDPKELHSLEEQVNGMGPLIDAELERVDRKHAQLTQLSADLVDALNLYHTLMREPQYQPLPKNMPLYNYGPAPQQPNPNMYNGGPPMGPYPLPPFQGAPGDRQFMQPPVGNPMPPHGPGQLPPQFLPMGPGQVHIPPPPGNLGPQGAMSPQSMPGNIPNFAPSHMPSYGPPVALPGYPNQPPPPQQIQQAAPPPGPPGPGGPQYPYN